jgi:hypothetical protein
LFHSESFAEIAQRAEALVAAHCCLKDNCFRKQLSWDAAVAVTKSALCETNGMNRYEKKNYLR